MSTNYYLTLKGAVDGGIPRNWVQKIHIAQYTHSGFALQAIRGDVPFKQNINDVTPYYSPVDGFETVETWADMKDIILDPAYVVVDEYDELVETYAFIERIENQEFGADNRFNKHIEWMNERGLPLNGADNIAYLDEDGYTFIVPDFV